MLVFRVYTDIVESTAWPAYSLSVEIGETRLLEAVANNRDTVWEPPGEFTKTSNGEEEILV